MKSFYLTKIAAIATIAGGIQWLFSLPAVAATLTLPSTVEKVILLDVDVSGSVSNDAPPGGTSEYDLMMGGYEKAFRTDRIQDAIINYSNGTSGDDGIVVGLQFWSTQQEMMTDSDGNKWFYLTNEDSITSFADTIAGSTRPAKTNPDGTDNIGGGTNLAGALDFSNAQLNALFTGSGTYTNSNGGTTTVTNSQGVVSTVNLETVIDVSSDGYHDRQTLDGNSGGCDDDEQGNSNSRDVSGGLSDLANCQTALANAISAVLSDENGADRINGLPIKGETERYRDLLDTYYESGLTTDSGDIGPVIGESADAINPAFIQTAASFNDFDTAIEDKLYREISEVPFEFSPTLGLVLSGGVFAGLHQFKKRIKNR